jgi:predicted site-specific integrase-resolvase
MSVPEAQRKSADAKASFSRLSAMNKGDLLHCGRMGRDEMTKTQGKRVSKRVAVYLRVSTTDQTTTNQRRELHAVAKRHGWSVVRVFEDAGISGAKGR